MFLWEGDMADRQAEVPLHQHCSMGNTQEELEATVLLESYGLVALLELGGMSPMTGASLLTATAYREPRLSREGGEMEGLPSNTKKWSEEMSLKNSQEQVKSL